MCLRGKYTVLTSFCNESWVVEKFDKTGLPVRLRSNNKPLLSLQLDNITLDQINDQRRQYASG